MKTRKSFFIALLLIFIMNSCEKEYKTEIKIPPYSPLSLNIDWDLLKIGVVNKDWTIVDTEISKLLVNSNPELTDSDWIGQFKSIDSLIIKINNSEKLSAELFCYACIKTLPAISEILVMTDSAGVSVSRIIDIITPDDSKLRFGGIHDVY